MSEKPIEFQHHPAAHTVRKRAQIQTLAKLGDDPDWWAEQMDQIATQDQDLEQLALALQVNYSVYRHWIMGDTKREREYVNAIAEQKKRRIQRVEDKLLKTALNPTGHPTHSDSNRAAEILLGRLGGAAAPSAGASLNLNISFVDAKDGKPAEKVISGEVVG